MKSKFFTTIFILFVLMFLAFAGWFYIFSKISSERREILELRKNIMSNEKKSVDENSLVRFLNSVKKEKETIESVFLKEDDLIRLIKGLESIGESSGVSFKIESISVEKSKDSKPIISFSAKGTFGQLFKHLYLLENIPYFITINKVSFQNEKNDSESDSIFGWQALFSIQLESYEN